MPQPESGQSESQKEQTPASPAHWPLQDPDGSATIARSVRLQLQYWQIALLHRFLSADDSFQIQLGYIAVCPDRSHNGDLGPDPPHWQHHSVPQFGLLPAPESSHPVCLLFAHADKRKYLLNFYDLQISHRHKWYRVRRR